MASLLYWWKKKKEESVPACWDQYQHLVSNMNLNPNLFSFSSFECILLLSFLNFWFCFYRKQFSFPSVCVFILAWLFLEETRGICYSLGVVSVRCQRHHWCWKTIQSAIILSRETIQFFFFFRIMPLFRLGILIPYQAIHSRALAPACRPRRDKAFIFPMCSPFYCYQGQGHLSKLNIKVTVSKNGIYGGISV